MGQKLLDGSHGITYTGSTLPGQRYPGPYNLTVSDNGETLEDHWGNVYKWVNGAYVHVTFHGFCAPDVHTLTFHPDGTFNASSTHPVPPNNPAGYSSWGTYT